MYFIATLLFGTAVYGVAVPTAATVTVTVTQTACGTVPQQSNTVVPPGGTGTPSQTSAPVPPGSNTLGTNSNGLMNTLSGTISALSFPLSANNTLASDAPSGTSNAPASKTLSNAPSGTTGAVPNNTAAPVPRAWFALGPNIKAVDFTDIRTPNVTQNVTGPVMIAVKGPMDPSRNTVSLKIEQWVASNVYKFTCTVARNAESDRQVDDRVFIVQAPQDMTPLKQNGVLKFACVQ